MALVKLGCSTVPISASKTCLFVGKRWFFFAREAELLPVHVVVELKSCSKFTFPVSTVLLHFEASIHIASSASRFISLSPKLKSALLDSIIDSASLCIIIVSFFGVSETWICNSKAREVAQVKDKESFFETNNKKVPPALQCFQPKKS